MSPTMAVISRKYVDHKYTTLLLTSLLTQCTNCPNFVWHDPPTPVHKVPEQVQLNFAIQRSHIESSRVTTPARSLGSQCGGSNCLTQTGTSRPANKACDHSPKLCSQCCKALGGCKCHRCPDGQPPEAPTDDGASIALSSDSAIVPSRAVVAHGGLQTPAVSRAYARPLDSTWGSGYYLAHQTMREAEEKLVTDRKLALAISNTVQVIFWVTVSSELSNSDPYTHIVPKEWRTTSSH